MFPDGKKTVASIVARMAPDAEEKEEASPDREVSEGQIAAAEDIMDVLSSYGPSAPGDNASKVEKATAEASRRARAKILAQAVLAFLDLSDAG